VFPITVPPLRERAEDISDLLRHFLARFNAEEGKRIRTVTADAMALLAGYSWPGNVRQLENAIFRAVVLAEGDELGVGEFPQTASRGAQPPSIIPPPSVAMTAEIEARPADVAAAPLVIEDGPSMSPAPLHTPHLSAAGIVPLFGPTGEIRPLEEIECEVI